LSQERAQSCVDYLVAKNIDKGRLIAKGYGKKQLMITDAEINKLTTEEEKEEAHQQNRRTEFKIIGN
jgi:outer membrane protein OmpA-like peptidoglycan-associated protein